MKEIRCVCKTELKSNGECCNKASVLLRKGSQSVEVKSVKRAKEEKRTSRRVVWKVCEEDWKN